MPRRDRLVRAWRSDSAVGKALRGALTPAAGVFRGVVALRNGLYDRGTLRAVQSPIPVVSVGNIAVGGAGKTPVAAWLAQQLVHQGAAPGIIMRGYGGDEPAVHRELNPQIPVLLYGNRAAGVGAAARVGCDMAVLDDAFQHRAAARDEDIVLLAADSWRGSLALLPAGPWREPLTAVNRATLALITTKAADSERVDELREGIASVAPSVPVAVARLAPHTLRSLTGPHMASLSALRSCRVLAVAAVADPEPFFLQLERLGATVTRQPFGDHHRFTTRDAAALRAAASRHDMLVCTLKDAVKLRTMWPPDAPPAWYVSQAVNIEYGAGEVTALIRRLLAARAKGPPQQRDV